VTQVGGVTIQANWWAATLESVLGKAGSLARQKKVFLLSVFVPIMGLFLIIRIIPIILILLASFTNYSLKRPVTSFVGLNNFLRLFDDPRFVSGFWNSFEFVLVAVPLEIVGGLAIALLLSRKVKFEGFYQTLYFLPYILPTVPTAIIWRWIYAPGNFGLANYLLDSAGLARVGWLTDPNIALLAIIVMHVWKQLGFFVVVFLVGIKAIPAEFREASAVDGASAWQSVRHVDLPLLRPIILFGLVWSTIFAWSVFTEVYVMTQGSDVSAGSDLHVLSTRIYQEAFMFFNAGYGSAISFVLFIFSLLFVLLQFKALGSD